MNLSLENAIIKKILLGFVSVVFSLFFLFPYVWDFLSSFKTKKELYLIPITYLPQQPTLENYARILFNSPYAPFDLFFRNSIVVAFETTIITIIVCVLAAYSLARFKFVGRHTVLLLFLVTQMFPTVLFIVPLLKFWSYLNLLNTYECLAISNLSFTIPFAVWMLTGYFESIPKELEESAMVDGCTRRHALLRIVIPLAAPGIAATTIFAFINSWQDLFFPIMFTSSNDVRTLPAGLLLLVGLYAVRWQDITPGIVITSLPVIILFAFLQKYFVRALTEGALKG